MIMQECNECGGRRAVENLVEWDAVLVCKDCYRELAGTYYGSRNATLSFNAVYRMLRVSPNTLQKLVKDGKLKPKMRNATGRLYFSLEDVKQFQDGLNKGV